LGLISCAKSGSEGVDGVIHQTSFTSVKNQCWSNLDYCLCWCHTYTNQSWFAL